jgi:MerR family transcriptional regulator, light-induced transcriptional regulator
MNVSSQVGEGTPASEEPRYSIRLASRMSGVSEHTLRMWERRYGYPAPLRTSGGARRYSEDDVGRLKLVAHALEAGYRAGDVVGKTAEVLRKLIAEQVPAMSASVVPPEREAILAAIKKDDVDLVRRLLEQGVAGLGPRRFLREIAQPLLVEIGDGWQAGEIALRQEHIASHLLTTQLRVLLASTASRPGPPRVLLTTLPGEHHALPLDMVALYLKHSGATPLSLGVNTPIPDIASAAMALSADVVGVSIGEAADADAVASELRRLMGELPRRVELWLGGRGSKCVDASSLGARAAQTWSEIDALVETWRDQQPAT